MTIRRPPESSDSPASLFGGGLRRANNLKMVFREARNHLAGNLNGITRDETMARNFARIVFCKMHDEKFANGAGFRSIPGEDADALARRVRAIFESVKRAHKGVFEEGEEIELPPDAIRFLAERMEGYSVSDADRDVVGDSFEELISSSFRGGSGQFFTPRNVVEMMIDIIQPGDGDAIIDPACGGGGFLVSCHRRLRRAGAVGFSIVGMDKDSYLAKLAAAHLSLASEENALVFNENSLAPPRIWARATQKIVRLGKFQVVLTNPPFGARIPVVGEELLSQYALGRKWERTRAGWRQTNALHDRQPPQVLFIERCLQLLADGGRMGIVLPDGVFGNHSERHIWEYLEAQANISGVVSLAQETFQPGTHTKTSVLFLEKGNGGRKSAPVFMSVARAVGHDKNGKPIHKINRDGTPATDGKGRLVIDDDLPVVSARFRNRAKISRDDSDLLGFWVDAVSDHVYIPEYYAPGARAELTALEKTGDFDLVSVGELVESGAIQISRGVEIGARLYGTGDIPFVRTTDIVNWEIKFDPVKSVSEEIYRRVRAQQDVRANDILFVSDGTYLIGRSAMVTRLDEKIVIQSHIRKIRAMDVRKINPFYLFYLLNTPIVRRQIEAKIFVQATISTLGKRILEIVLPCAAIGGPPP